jgi:hypothetical protein
MILLRPRRTPHSLRPPTHIIDVAERKDHHHVGVGPLPHEVANRVDDEPPDEVRVCEQMEEHDEEETSDIQAGHDEGAHALEVLFDAGPPDLMGGLAILIITSDIDIQHIPDHQPQHHKSKQRKHQRSLPRVFRPHNPHKTSTNTQKHRQAIQQPRHIRYVGHPAMTTGLVDRGPQGEEEESGCEVSVEEGELGEEHA